MGKICLTDNQFNSLRSITEAMDIEFGISESGKLQFPYRALVESQKRDVRDMEDVTGNVSGIIDFTEYEYELI